jgi:hypothetical protein
MCGERILDAPYWIIPAGTNPEAMWLHGTAAISEVAPVEMEPWAYERHVTTQPPLCSLCAAVAGDICPHLRRSGFEMYRGHPTVIAFTGDYVKADMSTGPTAVPIDEPARRHVLGRELIVRVDVEESS